ncbi:hypothetical protein ScPMuIL_018120 [Solemya velum]
MPILCVGEARNPSDTDEDDYSWWQSCPDSLLLHIFSFLSYSELACVAATCKNWHRLFEDESLWKCLVRRVFHVESPVIAPGKRSWQSEYKRLFYESPVVLSETLTDHQDEVLHVSFSHDGKFFSTTSKDCTVKVWNVGYPTTLRYSQDFQQALSWDFTQFSCFNKSDSLLLVSSVKTSEMLDRRGYVAILTLGHDFRVLRVVAMDPSQLFGAWLDDNTFLGGYLEVSLDRFATTVQIEAFDVPEMYSPMEECIEIPEAEEEAGQTLFTFSSETASLIKFLTVANVPMIAEKAYGDRQVNAIKDQSANNANEMRLNDDWEIINLDVNSSIQSEAKAVIKSNVCNCVQTNSFDSRKVALPSSSSQQTLRCLNCGRVASKNDSGEMLNHSKQCNKNLIFVTGEFAVALHQLGIKSVNALDFNKIPEQPMDGHEDDPYRHMVMVYSNNDIRMQQHRIPDKPDHLIDLFGHVTGLCLSKDQRYLFLNCRPWKGKVNRNNPWETPELSSEIEVRVIDMMNLNDTGIRYRGHVGHSPSTMCCFVFLAVSGDFVASGSEDAKGYLWDRYYAALLSTFEHGPGVVNAVGFNPHDQEYLVTVSDDGTIKIWRSRQAMNKLPKTNASVGLRSCGTPKSF